MVSEHFSLEEVCHTDTGLENQIPEVLLPNAQRLAETVLEPWRVRCGHAHHRITRCENPMRIEKPLVRFA